MHTAHTAIAVGLLARRLPDLSVSFIAARIEGIARFSRTLNRLSTLACERELTAREQVSEARALSTAQEWCKLLSPYLSPIHLTDPRAGAGLALWYTGEGGPLPGNTMGGDESGYYL